MTIDRIPIKPSSAIRSDEVARFNHLAAAWWTGSLAVNYIASFGKPSDATL